MTLFRDELIIKIILHQIQIIQSFFLNVIELSLSSDNDSTLQPAALDISSFHKSIVFEAIISNFNRLMLSTMSQGGAHVRAQNLYCSQELFAEFL